MDAHKLLELQLPYVWFSDGHIHNYFDASAAIGQEIRRALGADLDIEDWDWATHPKPEMVSETARFWRSA